MEKTNRKKAQGAIEYLLLIGAAILVVAITITAITVMVAQGQEQGGAANETVIGKLDDLTRMRLVNEGKLSLGKVIPLTGKIRGPITRANGTLIANQADLNEAYANGEIIIYKDGKEISVAQKESTNWTGDINQSLRNQYNTRITVYFNSNIKGNFDGNKRIIKFIPKNPSSEPQSIAEQYAVAGTDVSNSIIIYKTDNNLDLFAQILAGCNSDYPNGLNDFKIEIYNYKLVLGKATKPGEIGIDPNTGIITQLGFTSLLPCENTQRYCALTPTMKDFFATPPLGSPWNVCSFFSESGTINNICYLDGIINRCEAFSCLSSNCDKNLVSPTDEQLYTCVDKTVLATTIDYFHWTK